MCFIHSCVVFIHMGMVSLFVGHGNGFLVRGSWEWFPCSWVMGMVSLFVGHGAFEMDVKQLLCIKHKNVYEHNSLYIVVQLCALYTVVLCLYIVVLCSYTFFTCIQYTYI